MRASPLFCVPLNVAVAPPAMMVRPLPSIEPLLQSNVPVIVTSPLPVIVPPESTKEAFHWLALATLRVPPDRVKPSWQTTLRTERVPEAWVIVGVPGTSITASSLAPGT